MILGLVEHDRGRLNPHALEMLTLARRLAADSGVPLNALLVGETAAPLAAGLAPYGVETVYVADHDLLQDYAPEAWAATLAQLAEDETPAAVLAAGTDRGAEVMAHVAARLGQPLAANCTAVSPGPDYTVTRIRWGGSLLEEARLSGAPKLLTVAPLAVAAETA
ncbi:MAG: electron transfer flavoprotein subunit alpha/FixB family protein, partial [Anaerolineales bacterium]|nr:electron transfer flavoprotein subunit alpha/FixB family protein [Anaerolineales bacterium]